MLFQEYEGGDILRKLKDGNIDRDKVKDVVTSFSALNMKSVEDDNSEGSEYITSGASWSSGPDVDVKSIFQSIYECFVIAVEHNSESMDEKNSANFTTIEASDRQC